MFIGQLYFINSNNPCIDTNTIDAVTNKCILYYVRMLVHQSNSISSYSFIRDLKKKNIEMFT